MGCRAFGAIAGFVLALVIFILTSFPVTAEAAPETGDENEPEAAQYENQYLRATGV